MIRVTVDFAQQVLYTNVYWLNIFNAEIRQYIWYFGRIDHLPDSNDKKVQYIPSVAEIGAGMEREAVSDDFHDGF